MFFCSGCQPKVAIALKFFNDIEQKQKTLDDKVKQLEDKLNSVTSTFSIDLSSTAVTAQPSEQTSNNHNKTQHTTACGHIATPQAPPVLPPSVSDRRYNIVVYGIEESPANTSISDR